jgi:hypothetical protein
MADLNLGGWKVTPRRTEDLKKSACLKLSPAQITRVISILEIAKGD